jgi:dihydrofolate reductase/thymidylate synthase
MFTVTNIFKNLKYEYQRFKSITSIVFNKLMSTNIKTNLIVAVDSNWGISKNNQIPWSIKEDSNFFQDVTKRCYIGNKKNATIMGKNTWNALPDNYRGLKDRINIVVSNTMSDEELVNSNITKSDIYLAKSLTDAVELCKTLDLGKIFICGGNSIYKEALEKLSVDEIYLTSIQKNYNCDNIFPYESFNKLLDNYKEHMAKEFVVNDKNNNDNVTVIFKKLYKGEMPQQFNQNEDEQQYLNLMENILRTGHFRQTRNSKTWSKFGETIKFDLSKGFPLLTTKKVFFRGIFEELSFFLKGDTNAKHLSEKGVKIWDDNSSRQFLDSVGLSYYDEGDIGPMYGFNWNHYGANYKGMNEDYTGQGLNQLDDCIRLLKTDPYSRRILMTVFNPLVAKQGCLWPCHSIVIQWYVEDNNRLSMSCYNRSQDYFLGSNFNLTMSSLLVHLFCEVINNDVTYNGPKFKPGRLIMNLGDTHLYEDHYEQSIRQILREPYKFPQLVIKRNVTKLSDFKYEDFELVDYQCYPNIIAKMTA